MDRWIASLLFAFTAVSVPALFAQEGNESSEKDREGQTVEVTVSPTLDGNEITTE